VVDGLHPRARPLGRVLARQRPVLGYFWCSLIGRTSTLPRRADGILEATWMASFRFPRTRSHNETPCSETKQPAHPSGVVLGQ
jgi:hypothetical protein